MPGKTYRLRLINMSALAMYHFWIEGHDMRIIEADGVDTQELPVDAITISVAQRYSILVTARNDTAQNWGIHANMVSMPERQLARHMLTCARRTPTCSTSCRMTCSSVRCALAQRRIVC